MIHILIQGGGRESAVIIHDAPLGFPREALHFESF